MPRPDKPAGPRWQPVRDEMISVDEPPPIPRMICADEEGWQQVKTKRKGRKPASPIPPSPPPARPDLADRMWHGQRYELPPVIKNGETLKSSRDFNMTPTKKNFRDKRADRRDERQRAACAEAHKQRRREPPPPAVNHRQRLTTARE